MPLARICRDRQCVTCAGAVGRCWGRAIPALGGNLGLPYLQSSPVGELSEDSGEGAAHPGAAGVDRGAETTGPERTDINAVDTVTRWQVVGCAETIAGRGVQEIARVSDDRKRPGGRQEWSGRA